MNILCLKCNTVHFWLLYSTNRCSREVLNEHLWPTCLIVQFYKHGRGLGTIKLAVKQLFINQRPDVVNSEWRSKSATLPLCQLCCSLISLVSVRTAVCIVTVQQKALVWLCPVSDISESWENNVTPGKLNPAALIIYVDAFKTAHKLMTHKPWMRLAHSHMHMQNMSWCTNSILKNFKRERTHVWHLVFCPVSQGSRPVLGCAGLSFWTRAGHWSFCAWSGLQHRKPQGCLDRRWDTFNESPVIPRNETHSQRAHCTRLLMLALHTHSLQTFY